MTKIIALVMHDDEASNHDQELGGLVMKMTKHQSSAYRKRLGHDDQHQSS
jgi:hypothetical protein